MILKIVNGVLILFAVFMGIKQGWAMTTGKEEMVAMFGKWQFTRSGAMIFGVITMLSSIMILFPKHSFGGIS